MCVFGRVGNKELFMLGVVTGSTVMLSHKCLKQLDNQKPS